MDQRERAERISHLNDAFRQRDQPAGQLFLTRGVAAMDDLDV
jgi:hypothetical protein